MNRSYILVLLFVCKGCMSTHSLLDHPIVFDEERRNLSLAYLSERYGLVWESPTITPKMIVLHHTVIPTLQESYEAFEMATLPGTRADIQAGGNLNVSSHFMVDRDGSIYQLLPETTMARHVIGLNHCAIGIENVGGTAKLPLTRAQLRANIWLIKYLKGKYDIDYLIGHHEYTRFVGHELWLEKDEGYRTKKDDPGKDFMRKVRQAVKKLNFKPVP